MTNNLEALRWSADKLADDAVERLLGPWPDHPPEIMWPQFAKIERLSRFLSKTVPNASVSSWASNSDALTEGESSVLDKFFSEAATLPTWADAPRIDRATEIFRRNGSICSISLFCACLPEVYRYPSITTLLRSSGQLELQAAYRIRSTAHLILPILLRGGLTEATGTGISSIIKVRLIHAIMRNLVTRGRLSRLEAGSGELVALEGGYAFGPYASTFRSGWNSKRYQLPCNQVEMAYVILCFGHVILRSLGRFGVHLSQRDQEDFYHAWSVIGHTIGVRRDLLADTPEQAHALFVVLRSNIDSTQDDQHYSERLISALILTMSRAIQNRSAQNFPLLMMSFLCGDELSARLESETGNPVERVVFGASLKVAIGTDRILRRFGLPTGAVQRIVSRVGSRFISEILRMDPKMIDSEIGQEAPAINPLALCVRSVVRFRHSFVEHCRASWDHVSRLDIGIVSVYVAGTLTGVWVGWPDVELALSLAGFSIVSLAIGLVLTHRLDASGKISRRQPFAEQEPREGTPRGGATGKK